MFTALKDSVKVMMISAVILFSAYAVMAAWTAPTIAPTGGNITFPLNTGSAAQSKEGSLTLNTGGSTNGLIVSAGNVGIGAASPSSKLHVSGGSTVDAELIIEADTANNNEGLNPFITFKQDGGGHDAFIGLEGNSGSKSSGTISNAFIIGSEDTGDVDLQFITSDTARMTILRNGGLVGIGTAAPDAALSVKTSGQNAVVNVYGVTSGTDYGAIQVSSSGGLTNPSTRPLSLQPNAGKVGIGTTTPSQALSVNGTIYSGTGGFKFPDGTMQTSASSVEAFGGYYSKGNGSCTNPNPLTGACSCPVGFNDNIFLNFSVNASFSCGWYEGYTYTGPCGQRTIETHQCWNPDVTAVCGNNIREGSEVCDGTDLNSQTCSSQVGPGYIGTLSCNAGCSAFVTNSCALASSGVSQSFAYTGSQQTFIVPPGITSITVDASGAQGSGPLGGAGGRTRGDIAVTPGETLYLYVGGTGGYNGGGISGNPGGGATDVRRGGTALANRVVVAAGGGGSGSDGDSGADIDGGVGGGLTGGTGGYGYYGGGEAYGGTQSAGGAGASVYEYNHGNVRPSGYGAGGSGSLGQGGTGASGGGGGYYGGAGGSSDSAGPMSGSGGGGSALIPPGGTTTSGYNSGNGSLSLSWVYPNPYVISTSGTYSFIVPPLTNSLIVDLRGPGGAGGGGPEEMSGGGGGGAVSGTAGSGGWGGAGGAAGSNSYLRRSATTLTQAAIGAGGNGGSGYDVSCTIGTGGSMGTNVVPIGGQLTAGGGGSAGAAGTGTGEDRCGPQAASPGNPGDKVTGSIPVNSGETLTISIGTPGGGGGNGAGAGEGSTPGSAGGNGYISISW